MVLLQNSCTIIQTHAFFYFFMHHSLSTYTLFLQEPRMYPTVLRMQHRTVSLIDVDIMIHTVLYGTWRRSTRFKFVQYLYIHIRTKEPHLTKVLSIGDHERKLCAFAYRSAFHYHVFRNLSNVKLCLIKKISHEGNMIIKRSARLTFYKKVIFRSRAYTLNVSQIWRIKSWQSIMGSLSWFLLVAKRLLSIWLSFRSSQSSLSFQRK